MNRKHENIIGKIRRSQAIMAYGPGAIIDLRTSKGAPLSIIACGMEDWENSTTPKVSSEQNIQEQRLCDRLGVQHLRPPPISKTIVNNNFTTTVEYKSGYIPAKRFPNWHICPKCDDLRPYENWRPDPDDQSPFCSTCSKGRARTYALPAGFIVACEDGHLSDFPWQTWVKHTSDCLSRAPKLKLSKRGAGLKGLLVICKNCQSTRNMHDALGASALHRMKYKCKGESPWLDVDPQNCLLEPRVINRGASNTYFPIIESSIDIPPWGSEFEDNLGQHWAYFATSTKQDGFRNYIEDVVMQNWPGQEKTVEEILEKVLYLLSFRNGALNKSDFLYQEYIQFQNAATYEDVYKEFKIKNEDIPKHISKFIGKLVRVERLREVKALVGFKRLTPPTISGNILDRAASIGYTNQKWLPGIETRGEGIFISLDPNSLEEWESRDLNIQRAKRIEKKALEQHAKRNPGKTELPISVTPGFLLLHTFSHALMQQLSLECGYGSSSLSERIYYSNEENTKMCGVLIYTSTTDSDGTLGGLSRMGKQSRILTCIIDAIKRIEWCSSDPLCSAEVSSGTSVANLAACHACVYLPETSCQFFNNYLDRGFLVGTDENPEIGFFKDLLE